MELILKLTGACNFACSFCSAYKADIMHLERIPDRLEELIGVLRPNGLIITGGDPLMVKPELYYRLLEITDCRISLTSNLKGFVLNPAKWEDLFRNPRIGVCTSFQYGTGRKWDEHTVYDEHMFRNTMKMFKDRIGYTPMFISVISDENEALAVDHVYLAKELGTKCKLNGVLDLGRSSTSYPLYRMIDIWLEIQERGLQKWQDNSIQMLRGGCNFNTNLMCQSTIRSAWFDKAGNLKYSTCEDCALLGTEVQVDAARPRPKIDVPSEHVSWKCISCPLFRLCNGCAARAHVNRLDPNFCGEMTKRKDRILNAGWKV